MCNAPCPNPALLSRSWTLVETIVAEVLSLISEGITQLCMAKAGSDYHNQGTLGAKTTAFGVRMICCEIILVRANK